MQTLVGLIYFCFLDYDQFVKGIRMFFIKKARMHDSGLVLLKGDFLESCHTIYSGIFQYVFLLWVNAGECRLHC